MLKCSLKWLCCIFVMGGGGGGSILGGLNINLISIGGGVYYDNNKVVGGGRSCWSNHLWGGRTGMQHCLRYAHRYRVIYYNVPWLKYFQGWTGPQCRLCTYWTILKHLAYDIWCGRPPCHWKLSKVDQIDLTFCTFCKQMKGCSNLRQSWAHVIAHTFKNKLFAKFQ